MNQGRRGRRNPSRRHFLHQLTRSTGAARNYEVEEEERIRQNQLLPVPRRSPVEQARPVQVRRSGSPWATMHEEVPEQVISTQNVGTNSPSTTEAQGTIQHGTNQLAMSSVQATSSVARATQTAEQQAENQQSSGQVPEES